MTTMTEAPTAYQTRDMLLNVGPAHPAMHGIIRIVATVGEHGEERVPRHHRGGLPALVVHLGEGVAEPPLELGEDRHALSTSASGRRSCPAAS